MVNCGLLRFRDFTDGRGHLSAIEGLTDVPFPIQRVYYITGVGEGVTRGFHAHQNLHQALLCLNGSVKIRTKTPVEEEVFTLDSPAKGLYIGKMVWREMFDFSPGAVLMVLASQRFSEEDYIRDYAEYEKRAKIYYNL